MPLPQYVSRRGDRLYYRRAYPQELWPVTGRAPFAMSLRTADPKEALRSRPEAERRYQREVDAAREKLARRRASPPLTRSDAETIAVRWFLEALDNQEAWRWVLHPNDPDAPITLAHEAAADARRELAQGELPWSLARCLRDRAGFSSETEADRALALLLARASVAASEVEAGRAAGRYGARPEDPLFAAAMEPRRPVDIAPSSPSQDASGRTIEDLIKAYRKSRLPGLSPAAEQGYAPVFRLLKDVLGPTAPLTGLTHEDGERLFDAVKGLPANAEKLEGLKGLPVPDQVEQAKRRGLRTLAPKTINDRYMANIGAIFRFAMSRGWMQRNPVQGLRARTEVAAAEAREPFGAERLRVLFGGAPWDPRDAAGGGNPIRYWGPLLSLYHGLRLGEIAGLRVNDIGEEQGQLMLLVRAGERALKTASARRDIPLHPELVRLGFPAFIDERRDKAPTDAPLFAGEKAYARGQWGRSLGYWFVRVVVGRGLTGRRLTFHSLRHDFRDALREAEVERGLADYLMGHAQQGVGALYGAGRPSLARLKEAVARVRYEGLALPD